jgi:hypothetical protein
MFKKPEDAIFHLENSFNKASLYNSKLSQDILELEGMSGIKTRHFYNNLLDRTEQVTYLEIGTWKGSTFISSMYKNSNALGIGIDSFTNAWGGQQVKQELEKNCQKFLSHNENYKIIEQDWYHLEELNEVTAQKFDVYLFDSSHEEQSQYDAFVKMHQYLADVCIVIIDDWDDVNVRNGTSRAKDALNSQYDFLNEIKIQYSPSGRQGSTDPKSSERHPGFTEFWNGMYATVLVKK